MRNFLSLMLLLSVVTVFGCGGQVVIEETTTDSVSQIMKPILEQLAETGDLEAAAELQSYIEEDLAGIDQAKSDALMADWEAMQAMSGTEEIKAAAQAMIDKL